MPRASLGRVFVLSAVLAALVAGAALSRQEAKDADPLGERLARLEKLAERQEFALEQVAKKVDDLLWFERVGDVAAIDKVFIPTVPNPHETPEYGIASERHPFKMWAYLFVPRGLDTARKHPLLVLPHGGVHADFDTYYTHVVRELMAEGYVVIAPEYRGSNGYGKDYYQAIDYGGLEVADAVSARDWAVETCAFVDAERAGILGWSHGGLIALLAAFDHPDKFRAAYAGVPVSDLVARMGYQTDEYRDQFSAEHHIGKIANEDVEEYRRRSPVWNVHKLAIPLLIHTSTNDRDVHVLEVESLIRALKAEGKEFEHRIYEDAPGGHSFNRMDSTLARESRREVYAFLARHLKG
ncbi:MAG: S9 family peptidase [Planctomycetes bacterium]|nr:S9 family peptidase [Planctomycetota bacterium]